ncbi:hypothetical protein OVW19_30105, partial [Klebsiella pneumoniae]|uniref:hypothetical protein n=1 Tax=Klebsiella pneumoniae TaxID=573 RepID=UPI0022708BFD
YDVYYVESHARTPTMLMETPEDDSSSIAAHFIADVAKRFDFRDRWAFHALHADGQCHGMTHQRLEEIYDSVELIINLHGGTHP